MEISPAHEKVTVAGNTKGAVDETSPIGKPPPIIEQTPESRLTEDLRVATARKPPMGGKETSLTQMGRAVEELRSLAVASMRKTCSERIGNLNTVLGTTFNGRWGELAMAPQAAREAEYLGIRVAAGIKGGIGGHQRENVGGWKEKGVWDGGRKAAERLMINVGSFCGLVLPTMTAIGAGPFLTQAVFSIHTYDRLDDQPSNKSKPVKRSRGKDSSRWMNLRWYFKTKERKKRKKKLNNNSTAWLHDEEFG
ncbi:hypothetical protein DL93DRAFT_2156906 [Clavulina sp. PMI_390]|nr:hypothetical protein DL93DRAFT_2156906 [Clavulina sp. PMI_390]